MSFSASPCGVFVGMGATAMTFLGIKAYDSSGLNPFFRSVGRTAVDPGFGGVLSLIVGIYMGVASCQGCEWILAGFGPWGEKKRS